MKKGREYYTTAVMTASPLELVVLTYEAIFERLDEALDMLSKGDTKGFDDNINWSKDAITELIHSLDAEYKISYDLLSMYSYSFKLLNTAFLKRDEKKVMQCKKVLMPLYEAWKELLEKDSKLETHGVDVRPSVVAGMTYGKSDIDMVGNFGSEFKA